MPKANIFLFMLLNFNIYEEKVGFGSMMMSVREIWVLFIASELKESI